MKSILTRRDLVQTATLAGASVVLPQFVFAGAKKSVLVFTKSSGFEHEVVKTHDGKPSIVDQAVTSLGKRIRF